MGKKRRLGGRDVTGGEGVDRKKKKKFFNAHNKSETTSLKSLIEKYPLLAKADTADLSLFDKFPLSSPTQKGLAESDFTVPTDIQRESLKYSLPGADVVGAAKTGHGKTLAFLIPLLECLFRNRWSRVCDGLGAIVISPTRELAFQTFAVLNKVGKHHHFSVALLIGGREVEYEWSRLGNVNIIVCTPGRLLQHMDENAQFSCDAVKMLVIDEADRLLDAGFMPQMNAILENLPSERQTLLFSATLSRNVEELTRVALHNPMYVSVNENAPQPTPDNLNQVYFICPEEKKINLLWSFLVRHRHEKTLIFVSCCKQARFLTTALCHLRPGLSLMGLWGTMKQAKRLEVFEKFNRKTVGAAVIATDVASRGLDFERVDWVFQLDCPATVVDYIHRVGRTARMDAKGCGALVLTPAQKDAMLAKLEAKGILLTLQKVKEKDMFDIGRKLQSAVAQFPNLKGFAQQSFVAFVRTIHLMPHGDIFDVSSIDIDALAKSYGLAVVPRLRFLKRAHAERSQKARATPSASEAHIGDEENDEVEGTGDEEESVDDNTDDGFEEGGRSLPGIDLGESDEEGGGDDLLRVTREDVFHILDKVEDEKDGADVGAQNAARPRNVRRTRVKVNTDLQHGTGMNVKKVFTDDGDELVKWKQGEVPEAASAGVFDLEEAKREMADVDKADRVTYKEKQRKWRKEKKEKQKVVEGRKKGKRKEDDELDLDLRDSDDDGSVDLSWLPDPDKPKRFDANWNEMENDHEPKEEKEVELEDEESSTSQISRRKRQERIRNAEKKALQFLEFS